MRRRTGDALGTALAACVAFLIAVLAYHEILGYWFTGVDTIPLIETSRVSSLEGVWATFARPLMDGSHFTDRAMFYRPIASLSYALDYWVWGLDPFGYHLTDLLLHASAAALVVVLVRVVLEDTPTAVLAGVLFGIHPLTVEVVPTPARRHDVLATVFVLVAMASFVRAVETVGNLDGDTDRWPVTDERDDRAGDAETAARSSIDPRARSRRRYRYLGVSVLAYLLALGSKETAIIVPVLVAAWIAIRFGWWRWWDRSLRRTLRAGVALFGPFAATTAAYLVLRIHVLGGLGGYDRPAGAVPAETITTTASRYVFSLLYPVDFVGALSSHDLQLVPNGLYVVLAGASLLVVHDVSRRHGIRPALASARGRLLALSGVWLVVPVFLFVRADRYTVRSGYVSVVPIAVVLAIVVVGTAREVRRFDEPPASSVTALAVGSLLVVSLLAGSPLVHSYESWEHAGEVSKDSLTAIANGTEGLAPGATVDVYDVPHPRSTDRTSSFPQARSVTFIWGNSIESWLRLQGQPDRHVYINGTATLSDAPTDVSAERQPRGNRSALCLRYEPDGVAVDDGDPTGATTTGTDDRTVDVVLADPPERTPCATMRGTGPAVVSPGSAAERASTGAARSDAGSNS